MIARSVPIRRAARIAGMVAALLLVLPLLGVALTAAIDTWRLRASANDATPRLLLDTIDARVPSEGMTVASIMSRPLPGCDVASDRLPTWSEGPNRVWARWGPSDAFEIAATLLDGDMNRMSGRPAIRTRYIEDHTTVFERHFLLGCISGTLVAPLCARRVKALVAAADESVPPPDMRQRATDQAGWTDKTLCALAGGLSAMKIPPSPRSAR